MLVNGTTNYVYRAYTKSDDHPTVQASIDVFHPRSGLLAGAWVSVVDFGEARLEATPYAGKRWRLADDWRLDTLLAGYLYDQPVLGEVSDYGEAQALLHYSDILTLRAGIAPDAYGRGETVTNLQLDGRYPITHNVDVSAGLGYDDARAALGYDDVYWNLGVSWYPTRHLSVDLRYHDAEVFNGTEPAGGAGEHAPFETLLIDPSIVVTIGIGF